MDNKVYSKRFKDGTTTFPTRAFIENGWVIINQSEVVHTSVTTSYHNSIQIPLTDFRKMCEELLK